VRTVVYTVGVVAAEFVLGLGTALLFSALGKRSQLFRTAFLYPLMIAPVVAGLLWRFLLIDNSGIVGAILTRVGILSDPNAIGWLSDPSLVLFSVSIPDIWLTTAFMTLVLFAGLQNISGELLEAARLDGAGFWRMLWSVILPLLRPVIAVALIVRGIDAAKAFDIILVQTGGGPQNASTTMSLLIYRTMIRFGEPGLASAMAAMFLVAMLAVAVVAVRTIWRPGSDL
jgi:multiple sugar transport system permease protein